MKKLNNKNPFKTPESYFEDFSEKLTSRLSEEGTSLPENDGFIVPNNYFEGLHKNIQQKLKVEETKVIPLHPYKKYYYAVASIAAIALVLFALNQNTSKEITFEDIANSEIENYFENNELDFSTYEIAELVPVDELEIGDILLNGLDDEKVMEYLDNNTENFEELNLEYDE